MPNSPGSEVLWGQEWAGAAAAAVSSLAASLQARGAAGAGLRFTRWASLKEAQGTLPHGYHTSLQVCVVISWQGSPSNNKY